MRISSSSSSIILFRLLLVSLLFIGGPLFFVGAPLSASAQPTLPADDQSSEEAESTDSDDYEDEYDDEDYDDEVVEINDPLEGMNRGIFWFNDQVDIYVLEPLAEGYDWLFPRVVKRSVNNFFVNLRSPIYLVSDLVQLNFNQAAVHTGRFVINTTAGIGGLFDVAQDFGLEHVHEDFGLALGHHGVPSGPYIVLPLLGPSNARDAVGRVVDIFLNPTHYLGATDLNDDQALAWDAALTTLDAVSTRARNLEAVESAKSASVDFYLFVRSAYQQQREGYINERRAEEFEEIEDSSAEDEETAASLEEREEIDHDDDESSADDQ